jgi:large subunit ribosomal protein L10
VLTKQQKVVIVENLTEAFKDNDLVLMVDYKGLNVAQFNELRSMLSETGAKIRVVKNKLLNLALQKAGFSDEHSQFLTGTTAVVYSTGGEPVDILKVLVKFSKSNESLKFKGGYFYGDLIDSEQVVEYSKLPSREELLATLLNRMQAPISGLVFSLSGILRKFLYALNAIKEKKSGGGE